MNMKIAKIAAAAVLLIGAFVGFGLFDGTSSVSWAQVRDQVAQGDCAILDKMA